MRIGRYFLLGVAARENMLVESHSDRVERFALRTPFGLRHRRKLIVRKGRHLSSLSEIAAKLMNPLVFLSDLYRVNTAGGSARHSFVTRSVLRVQLTRYERRLAYLGECIEAQ